MTKVFVTSSRWWERFWPRFVTSNQVTLPEISSWLRKIPVVGWIVVIGVSFVRATFLALFLKGEDEVMLLCHKEGIQYELSLVKAILGGIRSDLKVTIRELPQFTNTTSSLETC